MAVTPNYSWPVPVATDYVKDGWEAISDLGNAIDTTVAGLGSSGLSLVTTNTLSGSSGCIFTNLVAGTKYKIIGAFSGNTNNIGIYGRFRENTTDKTTDYYSSQYGTVGNSTSVVNFGDALWFALSVNGAQAANAQSFISADFYIYSGGTSAFIIGNSTGADSSAASSPRNVFFGSANKAMSACNGINIYPTSGTISGSVSIFKYEV